MKNLGKLNYIEIINSVKYKNKEKILYFYQTLPLQSVNRTVTKQVLILTQNFDLAIKFQDLNYQENINLLFSEEYKDVKEMKINLEIKKHDYYKLFSNLFRKDIVLFQNIFMMFINKNEFESKKYIKKKSYTFNEIKKMIELNKIENIDDILDNTKCEYVSKLELRSLYEFKKRLNRDSSSSNLNLSFIN